MADGGDDNVDKLCDRLQWTDLEDEEVSIKPNSVTKVLNQLEKLFVD